MVGARVVRTQWYNYKAGIEPSVSGEWWTVILSFSISSNQPQSCLPCTKSSDPAVPPASRDTSAEDSGALSSSCFDTTATVDACPSLAAVWLVVQKELWVAL